MDKFSLSKDGLLCFIGLATSTAAISLSVYSIFISGGENMQLHPVVIGFLILAGIFSLIAIYFGIDMITQRIKMGKQKEHPSKPSNAITYNINSSDISNMNNEQLEAMKYIADKVQNK